MPNIVIYARYSSHNQNEQSIEGQLKTCYEFARQNDYTIIREYIDRAFSGTSDRRPEFQKMIEDSAKRQFEYVLVYQLDRFGRNRFDSATYKSRLKKNGVRVLSARENISDDASGILIESVLEGMAEYYSAELSQKIRRGMDLNASKCLATGGNIALGYYVDKEKHFQIDEESAHIVKTIFEMYANGSIMADIIRYLNNQNVKTSRGNVYNKNSIRRILTNKRYIGIYTYGDMEIKDGIPRIVSDELFNEVQMKISKNKQAPARSKAKTEYILTTKLYCGLCKSMMTGVSGTGQSGKQYTYYTCVSARKRECDKKSVQKDYIEDFVVAETRKLLTTENINLIAKEVVELCKRESDTTNMQRLKRLLNENKKATENLIKALEQGDITDIITGRIKQKKDEKEQLEKQLAEEQIKYPILTEQGVRFFMHQFKKGDINDLKYRKALIDTFVNRIYLYDDKMTILYNTQDGQTECHFEEKSSSNGQLVEANGCSRPSHNIALCPGSESHLSESFIVLMTSSISWVIDISLQKLKTTSTLSL